MAALHFEMVSPERLLMSGEVAEVQVPGTEGDFTVMPNHAPVLSTLRPGLVDIKGTDGHDTRFFVRGGFAEVNPKGLTLLAEQAVPMAELSPEVLAQEVQNAEEDVADAGDNMGKRQRAQERLDHLRQLQASL